MVASVTMFRLYSFDDTFEPADVTLARLLLAVVLLTVQKRSLAVWAINVPDDAPPAFWQRRWRVDDLDVVAHACASKNCFPACALASVGTVKANDGNGR